MSDLSDDDLMRLFAGGETSAFDALFGRYHAQVYRYASTVLGSVGGADDVLQESFLAVVQSAEAYVGQGKFRLWLMRIVRNRCMRRLQSASLRDKLLMSQDLDHADLPSPQRGPAQQVQDDEARTGIEAAIRTLLPRQREALALYALDEMTYPEIADLLALPLNTVKTLIRRARIDLAQRLSRGSKECNT